MNAHTSLHTSFLVRAALALLALSLGWTSLEAQDINRLREREENDVNNGFLSDYDQLNDSTEEEIDASTIPVELHMWRVDPLLGTRISTPVDTLHHHFQNSNLPDGFNGEYNHLGNLGSPRQSRVFFHQKESSQYFFTDPLSAFVRSPGEVMFTNTKSPFTNLTYHKAGSKRDGEDRFRSYFSVNVNKRLGLGFSFDYLYGRGQYNNQATSFFNGSLFGTYVGKHYELHSVFSYDKLKMGENDGIVDDRYITNPLDMMGGRKSYRPSDIPTNLSATWSRSSGFTYFLTHRYNLGFEREPSEEQPDKREFVPVTSLIHTLHIDKYERRFISYENPDNYYAHNYFRRDSADDVTSHLRVKNTIGISLREGFSRWARAGLTGFVSHEYRTFTLPDTLASYADRWQKRYREHNLTVGGELSKREGTLLHYNVMGEVALAGEDLGQFRVDGTMDLNFRLFRDTVRLDVHAFVKSLHPTFYYRHFHSTRYWWNNTGLSDEYRTRIEGCLSIDRWRTRLSAGIENVKNYTYLAQTGNTSPAESGGYLDEVAIHQSSGNIQVFSATLKQDFQLGILHLDNEITYQQSSQASILPLPKLNLYHNLYLSAKLAKKVLSVEIGADLRFFTRYEAPGYAPVVGQFCLQNPGESIRVGGYPLINVYANLHLKRTRLYVMMYHVNKGMGNSSYFLAPHYPENPRMFKFGLSWNFFD